MPLSSSSTYIKNYLENSIGDKINKDTNQIFISYAAFKQKILAIYREIDKEQTIEQKL